MVQDTVKSFAPLMKVMYFACSQVLREGIRPRNCKTELYGVVAGISFSYIGASII
jgi:hypothetical protein